MKTWKFLFAILIAITAVSCSGCTTAAQTNEEENGNIITNDSILVITKNAVTI